MKVAEKGDTKIYYINSNREYNPYATGVVIENDPNEKTLNNFRIDVSELTNDEIDFTGILTGEQLADKISDEKLFKQGGGLGLDTGTNIYDPSGEVGNNLNKTAVTLQTALKEVRDWANKPIKNTVSWNNTLITLNENIDYTTYNVIADHEITFEPTGHIRGNVAFVQMIFNGTKTLTITPPTGINLTTTTGFVNGGIIPAGIYDLSIGYVGNKIKVNLELVKIVGANSIAPLITNIIVEAANPNNVVMTFNENVTSTELGFSIAGSTSTVFASLTGSGTNILTGVLASPVLINEAINLSYNSVTGNAVDDFANALNTINNISITNNVVQLEPLVTNMVVEVANPNDLVVDFSHDCNFTNIGYTFRVDNVVRVLTSVSGTGTTTANFLISGVPIIAGQILDLAYDSTTGDTLRVSNSIELLTFVATTVTNSSSITSMSDNFDDNSIDIAKWNTLLPTNAVVTEVGGQLNIHSTGALASVAGLTSVDSFSSTTDLIVVQAKLIADGSKFSFGLSLDSGYDANERIMFIKDIFTANSLRTLITDGGVNESDLNSGISSDRDIRIKYTPSSGAVLFEYWNSSAWIDFGVVGASTDLGNSVSVFLFIGTEAGDTTANPIIYDNFSITDIDYSTQYPA